MIETINKISLNTFIKLNWTLKNSTHIGSVLRMAHLGHHKLD